MLPNIGMGELVVILAIALVLFGARKLPETAQALGRSVNAFKRGLKDDKPEPREIEAEKGS